MNFQELLDVAFKFHGHTCPAMPLGLRAGIAAMRILGVERARDKELHVVSETGKGHAAGCFLDGIMAATGCTYGKSNIEKIYYDKMAFTLVDVTGKKALRVSLKPDFFSQMLQSPFVKLRRQGIPPQDIPRDVVEPLLEKVLSIPEEAFLAVGSVVPYEMERPKGVFEAAPCAECGEMTFVGKLVDEGGKRVCLACSSKVKEER